MTSVPQTLTATTPQAKAYVSPEAYLEQEAQAEYKSEYRNGEVVAMAGAQMPHNQIVANILGRLYQCLLEKGCQVFPSDLLLKMPKECNQYVYPDITIVCGDVNIERHRGLDVLLNPTVIIEVLSSSSRGYDRGQKMECYLKLKSLRQYLMVDSERIDVVSYTQTSENDWLYKTLKPNQTKIKIHDCEIDLEDVYRNVKFEEK